MALQVMGTAYCATDPRLEQTKNNKTRAVVPAYIKDVWTDSATGEVHEINDHFQCVFWGANARRANELLMKGVQFIITSAKLRTIQHPNNTKTSFTQIWIDRWEVPSKVMMTKSFYNEIYKAELLPFKILIVENAKNECHLEVHVDKHTIIHHAEYYFQNPVQFKIEIKREEEVLYQSLFNQENVHFSNAFSDIYRDQDSLNSDVLKAETIHVELIINNKKIVEHTFQMKSCLHKEIKK